MSSKPQQTSIRERVRRALDMKISVPGKAPDRRIHYKHEGMVSIPGDLHKSTYYTRRAAGETHEEAITPRGHAKAADKQEIHLPGSRGPRKPPGHALRGWHAVEGEETPDQLAAVAKNGIR